MKALVTGGAGFIGSHLVDELLARGDTVLVLDNLTGGDLKNLSHCIDKITFIKGDLCNEEDLRKACTNCDTVFHLAAVASVPESLDNPQKYIDVNITGTKNLLEASKNAGVTRFVFSSSSAVYGDSTVLPAEEEKLGSRLSPYAISKYAGEDLCRFYHNIYCMETVCLRYFNVFGPRQNPNSAYAAVIPKFIAFLQEGKSPMIYGNGEQTRDFTYVANVVKGNILAATMPNVGGETINMANGEGTSVNTLAKTIIKLMHSPLQAQHTAIRKGDIKNSLANTTKNKALLGYTPDLLFDEGIKKTIEWYTTQKTKF